MSLGRAARLLRAQLHQFAGTNRRARLQLDGSRAAVLNYHRVLSPEAASSDAVDEGMFVTPETFERHLDWLGEFFHVLPLGEVLTRLASGQVLPDGACCLTFDDGWRDNFEIALPALEARSMPATVFVVTGRVGSTGAFWPEAVARALRRLEAAQQSEVVRGLGVSPGTDPVYAFNESLKDVPKSLREERLAALWSQLGTAPEPAERELVNWPELERMASGVFEVEAHGVSHDMLTGLDDAAALAELTESQEALRERGYGRNAIFAYPAGRHDKRIQGLAAEAGYRAAVTIERGMVSRDSESLALPRLMLHEGMSATRAEFLMRIPGRTA